MARDPQSGHYDAGGIEVIDVIEAKLTPEQYKGYLLGNAIKYQLRLNFKLPLELRLSDAMKAANHSQWLVDFIAQENKERKD